MGYYYPPGGAGGGGGGGNQFVMFEQYDGGTYATGGFVIDLSATYSTLNWLKLALKTVGANLPVCQYELTYDSPAPGQATVKIMRHRYDLVSAFGNVANQPGGVTVQAAAGGTSSSEAAHTHSIDHDHPSFTSAANANAGAGVLDQILGSSIGTHTHDLDLPNLTGTSGAGTSHNHTDNSIYQHQHGANQTATDLTTAELANGTDLSGTTWYLMASGVGPV